VTTRLPTERGPCAYHAALESEVRAVREEMRTLSDRVWDVMERLADDRPSRLEIVRTHRPTTPAGGTSIPPTRRARESALSWLTTVALALGLAIGLGIAAGTARACGVSVPPALGAPGGSSSVR
jgi:hypothetical protein